MDHSILLAQLDKQIDTLAHEVGGDYSLDNYSYRLPASTEELRPENTISQDSNQDVFIKDKDILFNSGPDLSFSLKELSKLPSLPDLAEEPSVSGDSKEYNTVSDSQLSLSKSTADQGKVNDINGILIALETCQIKIQELEKEKSESKNQIKSLEQELSSARQLLFLKAGSSGVAIPDPLYKSQSLEKLQKLKSNWIQDARNEVEELRKKVEMEKQRQSKRLSKEYLFDDLLNSTNDESINEDSIRMSNDVRGREEAKYERKNHISTNDYGASKAAGDIPKLNVNIGKIEPPARAHVRSPSYSPVRSGLDDAKAIVEMDSDVGFLKQDQIGQLKDEILSNRKSLSASARSNPKKHPVKSEKLKVYPPKPPAWKNVQGRPKSAAASSIGNKKPHTSKISRKDSISLKRELPFTVGQNPGKSYSVTANIQKVYSLLKSHNPTICNVCSDKSCDSKCNQKPISKKPVQKPKEEITKIPRNEILGSSASSVSVLTSNLSSLEREFDRLKGEYNTLVTQYENALGNKAALINLRDVGNNLKHVIQSMETKSDQIAILKQILHTAKTSETKKRDSSRPLSPNKVQENLGLLKNSRIVQESLTFGMNI